MNKDNGLTIMEAAVKEAVRFGLYDNRGNLSATARALGISRGQILRKVRKFGLNDMATKLREEAHETVH
jgi:transcriptional regulator of acetoin/glycerol metabolism